jgi:hypothetical protein
VPQSLSGRFWGREKSLIRTGIRNTDSPAHGLVTILTSHPGSDALCMAALNTDTYAFTRPGLRAT